MEWNIRYGSDNPPSFEDIDHYVNSRLWNKLNLFLQSTYRTKPKLSYSRCSMQPGWNVKYRKSGRSLCVLYPMEGFFIALVVISSKESYEAELILPSCSQYIQTLYSNTVSSPGGRWLMIQVKETAVLEDVTRLIQIRANP